MLESVSFYDTNNESFYHGMMLGLCAMLNNRYFVKSNKESGYGRFDIELMPKIKNIPGFIFELKRAKNEKDGLETLATKALQQIDIRKYDSQMQKEGIKEIIKIGIAFYGKKAVVKSE